MQEENKIETLTENLKDYLGTSCELFKLEATERSSTVAAGLISGFFIALFGLLLLLFISLAVAFYISNCCGNNYCGFIYVAGFYLLLTILLLIGKEKIIDKQLRNKIIQKILSK